MNRVGRRGWTIGSLVLALGARLLSGPLPLNYYDIGYALVWGRQIISGQLPDYRTPGASTPHPLGTLLATLGAALGPTGAWYLLQTIVFLSLGIAGSALFVLTRTCLGNSWAVGNRRPRARANGGALLAVGALLLSRSFLTDALGNSGLSDLPALALVLWAAALAVERPGRSRVPLLLLGLAGLMRPEAWGLGGAYWLYLAARRLPHRELFVGAGLVLAAPLVWALADTIVVGNPTYSLSNTQAASQTGIFAHGLGQVPSALWRDLRALVGVPVLALGTLGALVALTCSPRATAAPLGLLALTLGAFAALGIAEVPLLERFLLIPAAMICLFFAYALLVAGQQLFVRFAGGSAPRVAGAAATTILLAYLATTHLTGAAHVRGDQRAAAEAEADLLTLARETRVRAAVRRCPVFYVPRFTLTSLVAFDFDLSPRVIHRTTPRPPPNGLILAPVSLASGRSFGVTGARLNVLRQGPLASADLISHNRSWELYRRGCPSAPAVTRR